MSIDSAVDARRVRLRGGSWGRRDARVARMRYRTAVTHRGGYAGWRNRVAEPHQRGTPAADLSIVDLMRGVALSRRRPGRRPFSTAVVLLSTVVAVVACSPRTSPPTRVPSSASGQPSTPSRRAAAEAQALAAYDGMWQAMAKAGEVPDPDAPELRQHATGDALARVVGALVNYGENGQVTRGRPVSHASVASATPAEDPTEVNVVDCDDSTNWTTHNRATGAQISPDPRGRRHITAVVKKIDGTWKVTTFEVGEIGSC